MSWTKRKFLSIIFLLIFNSQAHADICSQEKAVQCILGEARGEYAKYGENSLLAVAEAIRNRGTLQGVYGCKADISKELSYLKARGIYKAAELAWVKSQSSKLIDGAQYWGSTIVDKKWIATMKKAGYKLTYTVGNQAYYKKGK